MFRLQRPSSIQMKVVLLILIQLSSVGKAQKKCVDHVKIDSSDTAYNNLKQLPKQKQAAGIHDILKNALYPLMERVQTIGLKLKARDVRQMLEDYQIAFLIKEAEYMERMGGRIPLVGSRVPWGQDTFIFMYNNLTGHNLKFFRWTVDPAFAEHQSQKALWVEPSEKIVTRYGAFFQMLSIVPTPINAYGERFSKNLLRTTQIMMNLVYEDPVLRDMAAASFDKNQNIFLEEVGRVQDAKKELADPRYGAVAGMMEGILSFHQFLSATLGEKIVGVDTGAEALRQIVQNGSDPKLGLTAEFTSRLPMGLIAPLSNSGYYIKSPFKVEPNGKLSLSANLKAKLAEFATKGVAQGRRKGRCPMAGLLMRMNLPVPKSMHPKIEAEAPNQTPETETSPAGVQLLAETYLRIFKMVDAAAE
jgi:hypothetical protein